MMEYPRTWDAIVVGGGHAGCEAAHALATMGASTLLFTMNVETIGAMSCNPAIGGQAKGHLVREIDALGGIMGRVADAACIHYKRLNLSKGPAVWSSRAQSDMAVYRREMLSLLQHTDGLDIKQGTVERLILEEDGAHLRVRGIVDRLGIGFRARAVILTTGTFLRGLCHVGQANFAAGRAGDIASVGLAEQLARLGLDVGRLKTGTTPRLDARTIDFAALEPQPGDAVPGRFSFYHDVPRLRQIDCHITRTTPRTHEVIRGALDRSPMFNGTIEGIGPRYCPSIEDKVHRFADRDGHTVFLEPHGLDSREIYPSGISTSLPYDVQIELVRSIPGLERAEITRPGYAVEYDFVNPIELHPWLELKKLPGLFLAGQINGTSGYEEAAAQGIVAGINAALRLRRDAPMVLRRDESYIGVLIDDLVTRGTEEPYRMFTSRAEFRLLLREDNADRRLSPRGHAVGLLDSDSMERCSAKSAEIDRLLAVIRETRVTPSDSTRARAVEAGIGDIDRIVSLDTLLSRPGVTLSALAAVAPGHGFERAPADVAEAVEIECRYRGYVERQQTEAVALRRIEDVTLPEDIDYDAVSSLSNEVRQKLARVRPATLGQASRIAGVTPAAITTLWIWLRRRVAVDSATHGAP